MKVFNRYIKKSQRKELRNNLTQTEIILWSKLKNRQLQSVKFRRQHSIGKYIVDFYSPELELVIEVDGADHTFTDAAMDYDRERDNFLKNQGLRVLRISSQEVKYNLSGVLEDILKLINNIKSFRQTPSSSPLERGRKLTS